MKNFIKKFLASVLILPILFLCSCSGVSDLPSINMQTYFEDSVTATVFNNSTSNSSTRDIPLSVLTANSPNTDYLDRFVEFELEGNGAWLYKMYIDKIVFYVYTNESSDSEMIVNFSITNVAHEDDLELTEEFTGQCSFYPQSNGSAYCELTIDRVIATATGSTITFDILNSTSGTVADEEGNTTSFRWVIYGFKIYGESRSYS